MAESFSREKLRHTPQKEKKNNSGCKVLSCIITTTVLYCFIVLSSIKYVPHNRIKQNLSFYAMSYPYKTHVCVEGTTYNHGRP